MANVDQRQEVAFNMGVAQSIFVAGLYTKAINHFLDGNFKGCYDVLNGGLRAVINSDLKETEIGILDELETKINQKHFAYVTARNRRDYLLRKEEYVKAVKEYMYKIFAFLRILGYLPSKKQREMLF